MSFIIASSAIPGLPVARTPMRIASSVAGRTLFAPFVLLFLAGEACGDIVFCQVIARKPDNVFQPTSVSITYKGQCISAAPCTGCRLPGLN